MNKIGILGGAFNPPHLGHLLIAEQISDELKLDQILFLPNFKTPNNKKVIDHRDRIKMIKLSIKNNAKFKMDLSEIKRKGTSYTINTIEQIKQKNPENDYYFIVGADELNKLDKWYKINELNEMITFIGVNRYEDDFETKYNVIKINVSKNNVSSTEIRSRIKNNKSIKYLVNEDVEKYIKKKGLYK